MDWVMLAASQGESSLKSTALVDYRSIYHRVTNFVQRMAGFRVYFVTGLHSTRPVTPE